MSQLAALRPQPRPTARRPGATPRQLKVVAPPEIQGNGAFLALCILLLFGGFVGVLVLNTAMAKGSYTMRDLQQRSDELADSQDSLRHSIDKVSGPGPLAQRARSLGMVPAETAAFLRLSDGKVLGVAKPAGTNTRFRVVTESLPPARRTTVPSPATPTATRPTAGTPVGSLDRQPCSAADDIASHVHASHDHVGAGHDSVSHDTDRRAELRQDHQSAHHGNDGGPPVTERRKPPPHVKPRPRPETPPRPDRTPRPSAAHRAATTRRPPTTAEPAARPRSGAATSGRTGTPGRTRAAGATGTAPRSGATSRSTSTRVRTQGGPAARRSGAGGSGRRPRSRRRSSPAGSPRRRMRFLTMATLFVLSIFAAQLVRIQGFDAHAVAEEAQLKREAAQVIPAMRGTVLASDGTVLASSVVREVVVVDQQAVCTFGTGLHECDPTRSAEAVRQAATLLAPLLTRPPRSSCPS